MFYAIVTFGSPSARRPAYVLNLEKAKAHADAAKGTGTCTAARVIECPSRVLALTADISRMRPGERTVYEA